MSHENCPANCWENPGGVDKIGFKCVECKTDLKDRMAEVHAGRIAATAERIAAEVAASPQTLTDEQIADRRAMSDE